MLSVILEVDPRPHRLALLTCTAGFRYVLVERKRYPVFVVVLSGVPTSTCNYAERQMVNPYFSKLGCK